VELTISWKVVKLLLDEQLKDSGQEMSG